MAFPCSFGSNCQGMNLTNPLGPRTLQQCPKQTFRTELETEGQPNYQFCLSECQCPPAGELPILWLAANSICQNHVHVKKATEACEVVSQHQLSDYFDFIDIITFSLCKIGDSFNSCHPLLSCSRNDNTTKFKL